MPQAQLFSSPEPCERQTTRALPTPLRDSGLQCLMVVARFHDVMAEEADLRHEFGAEPFQHTTLLRAAKHLGLLARLVRIAPHRLDRAALPAIAIDRNGEYFILAKLETTQGPNTKVLTQRPGQIPQVISRERFDAIWSGEMILIQSRVAYVRELAEFDFRWFIPAIIKYRRLFAEVLLISLTLHLIALASPLGFQVVMDKVLVNHAVSTLDVVACGLLVVTLFEATLSAIRSYSFAHTTSKMDIELGARLFRHLLCLPISYFHCRRIGDSVARIRELENIRAFLTGNAMTVLLDVAFSGVFLAVMYWYSSRLTLIVLTSIPLYIGLSLIYTPILRGRLNEKFNRGAENQAFLVEAIGGIDTLKAMALEPRWSGQWEKGLMQYVLAGLRATQSSLVAGGLVSLIGKLVTLAVIWKGAWEVMGGHLTVGELIAFNMLAAQVSAPVLRLAQLWNDFQQLGISMRRLGDILNARTETQGRRTKLPRIRGELSLHDVTFRYRPDKAPALRSVSFHIRPGQCVGIVGRSGSGKSTLTHLIQGLYVPETGQVRIDGYDLSTLDPPSLRSQIGVVPQDGTLFSRTVRENIALSNPSAPFEEVEHAARLAGAHDFICNLPEGYDTRLGEHGTGLSGGQRQRIAIARSLINNPRILIFDEATSALDYESEREIQRSMTRICEDRTVLIVAHRLAAIQRANLILVMDEGRLVEIGSHDDLLARKGVYSQLHRLQMSVEESGA